MTKDACIDEGAHETEQTEEGNLGSQAVAGQPFSHPSRELHLQSLLSGIFNPFLYVMSDQEDKITLNHFCFFEEHLSWIPHSSNLHSIYFPF